MILCAKTGKWIFIFKLFSSNQCRVKMFSKKRFDGNLTTKSSCELSNFHTTQCGNYGNLLPRFFGKNFVKATHLLNK